MVPSSESSKYTVSRASTADLFDLKPIKEFGTSQIEDHDNASYI